MSNAITPQNIDNGWNSFQIPLYQRLFTWSQNEIYQLLQDLLASMSSKSHYYIGALTCTCNNELVDGQQRFTVMMLLGIVFRIYNQEWDKFVKPDSNLRLQFPARPNDGAYMEKLVEVPIEGDLSKPWDYFKDVTTKDGYVNSYMRNGIETICSFITNIRNEQARLESNQNDNQILEFDNDLVSVYINYCYEHLAFFVQQLPKCYVGRYLNKHFETMNSSGKNLEAHEILKVELFSKVKDEKILHRLVRMWNEVSDMNVRILPTSNNYSEYYSALSNYDKFIQTKFPLENPKVSNESRVEHSILDIIEGCEIVDSEESLHLDDRRCNYTSFLTFTDFLLQVLFIHLLEEDENFQSNGLNIEKSGFKPVVIPNLQKFFNQDNLRDTFKLLDENKIVSFVEKLYRYRIIFDLSIIRTNGEGGYEIMTVDSEYSKLCQYESMLFCSTSRSTYYQWVPFLLMKVKEDSQFDEISLLKALKEFDNKINPPLIWNAELEFHKFKTYYFRRLDYYIWEKYILNQSSLGDLYKVYDSIIKGYSFHQYNSVEHFHPQTDKDHLEVWNEQNKNAFGNLALISSEFNSAQHNDGIAIKDGRIKDQLEHGCIESLKLLIMYVESGEDMSKWKIETMSKHGSDMIEILKDSYNQIC